MFSNRGFNNAGHHKRNFSNQSALCVCPKCGYTAIHEQGVPCSSKSCPVCKSWLMRHDASPSDLNSREVNNPQNVAVQSAQELVIEYPKVDVDLCIGCGVCVEICPVNAIVMNDDKAFIIEDMCRNCQKCVRACPVGAIS